MHRFMVRLRTPRLLESTAMDRSAAERLVKKDLDGTTGLGQADLEPRAAGAAHGRGLPEGRRPAALDGADRRDRPLDRRPEAPARALPPRAARGVRRTTARCSPSAGRAFAHRCRFDELNELIRQHNEWYPIERDLPMDLRTRDYVLINGRSYRREPLPPSGCCGSSRPLSGQPSGASGSRSSLPAPSVRSTIAKPCALVERDRAACCAGRPTARGASRSACACRQQRAAEPCRWCVRMRRRGGRPRRPSSARKPPRAPSTSATVTLRARPRAGEERAVLLVVWRTRAGTAARRARAAWKIRVTAGASAGSPRGRMRACR